MQTDCLHLVYHNADKLSTLSHELYDKKKADEQNSSPRIA